MSDDFSFAIYKVLVRVSLNYRHFLLENMIFSSTICDLLRKGSGSAVCKQKTEKQNNNEKSFSFLSHLLTFYVGVKCCIHSSGYRKTARERMSESREAKSEQMYVCFVKRDGGGVRWWKAAVGSV